MAELRNAGLIAFHRNEDNGAVAGATGDQLWPNEQPADSVEAVVPSRFFPARRSEPLRLQEGVGDHRHEHVTMQPGPRSAFKVVKAEFFLELLMRLFTESSGP